MKAKRLVPLAFLFSFCVLFSAETSDVKSQNKESPQTGIKNLIRKDLLMKERKKLEPSKRNIFAPKTYQMGKVDFEALREEQNDLLIKRGNETFIANQDLSANLDLRYIGFVKSGKKIVALILFEGQTMAVQKGDVISEGFTIGNITLKEIEILGPNSTQKKYSLEGEKP